MTGVEITGEGDRWEARRSAATGGMLRAVTRPDGRTFLSFRDCHGDAYAALAARAVAELGRQRLYTSVPEQDEPALRRLGALGFVICRRDHHYRIPVGPGRLRQPEPALPRGMALVSAADADLDQLRMLDDVLRNDTPNTDSWRWSPADFQQETFSDGFDPATYQVAVEEQTGAYVGLVRLWMKSAGPRFGFVGVLPSWRRTSVTYVLLSTVFKEVHRRGHTEVMGEVDATNWASNAIAARAGAVRIGGSYELVREAPRSELPHRAS